MIKLSSTASKFKQVGIFYITATLLVIHIQAIPENENTGTEKTFANSNSGEADNADEDHVKRALAEHKQKLRYNQVSAIVKPKHRLVHDNYSYMYASVWTAWSHWSICQNQERIRVRACSVIRGHRCFGNNLESKPCKLNQSITNSVVPNSVNSELLRNMAALKKSSLFNMENPKRTTNRPNVRAPQRTGPPSATPSPLYKTNTVERNKLVIFSTDNKQANRQGQNPATENATNNLKLPALFSTPRTLSEETSPLSLQKEPIKSVPPSSTITTSIAETPTLDQSEVEALKPNLHNSTANGKISFHPAHPTNHQTHSDRSTFSNELELQFQMETADWAPWSAWSNCECGQRTRTRTCHYSDAHFNSGCRGQSYMLEKCASTVFPSFFSLFFLLQKYICTCMYACIKQFNIDCTIDNSGKIVKNWNSAVELKCKTTSIIRSRGHASSSSSRRIKQIIIKN